MATMCLGFLVGVMIIGQTALGWQVTPNSPCASTCIDSIDLDISDANSSKTSNTDISCRDDAHLSTGKGQKFKSCMECLQDSSFSQGSENDQMWFLYNLRYTFNYCIYAYPNATGVDVGPCATSAACNVLKPGLISDELDPDKATPYGYCDSAITGEYFDRCLDCVRGDHTMNSLANYLIALQTGCIRKPAVGQLVGLNDTVFANSVEAVDPNLAEDSDNVASEQDRINPPIIIGAVVGVLALLGIVAGLLFVRHRKRRARVIGVSSQIDGRHGRPPVSPLSFRCQTRVPPTAWPITMFTSPEAAAQSPYTDEKTPVNSAAAFFQAYKDREAHQVGQLTNPSPIHHNGSFSENGDLASPDPVSAASTKSNTQLMPLRPYNPSEYAFTMPAHARQTPASVNSSPSLGGWPPVETRKGPTAWDTFNASSIKPAAGKSKVPGLGIHSKNGHGSLSGSPVESLELHMNFAMPPKRG